MLKYSKIRPDAIEPRYAHEGDACFDLSTCNSYTLKPNTVTLISTGLRIQVPIHYMMEIRSRSGLSGQGIIVANAPGTVDSGYSGELLVLLLNVTSRPKYIKAGDRIAQALLVAVHRVQFEEIEDGWQDNYSERGEDGFGSTGR